MTNQNKLPRRADMTIPRETFEDLCERITAFYYDPPDNPEDGDPSPQSIADVAAVKVSVDQEMLSYRHYVLHNNWQWGGYTKLPNGATKEDLSIRYHFSNLLELLAYLIDPRRFVEAKSLVDHDIGTDAMLLTTLSSIQIK